MTHAKFEGREGLENRLLIAYLLQLNRYALEKELIPKEIFQKMERNIRKTYQTW